MSIFSGSFSGSYEGNGSNLTNVNYNNLDNKPSTVSVFQGNSILANSAFRGNFNTNVKARLDAESVISSSAQLTTEFDTRYGNEIGDNLLSGSVDFSNLTNKPSGLISGSSQVTITESQISDLKNYLTALPNIGLISGSVLRPTGSSVISSSAQIAGLGFLTSESDSQTVSFNSVSKVLTISNGNSADLSSLGGGGGGAGGSSIWATGSSYYNVSADLQITGSLGISGITNVSSSIAQAIAGNSTVPSGTVSGSSQITSVITNTYISASAAASGFGQGGGGDVSSLNTFTGSINTKVNSLTSVTSSYLTSLPSGTVSSSTQITGFVSNTLTSSMSVATASFVGGNLSLFDGNRTISNTNLPSNVYNVNFGTSGSVSNFIEKIFFPNSVPTITTSGFTIGEFVVSGSSVGTISATDAEGQSVTFRTASSYTDDKFRIKSNGVLTLNTKSTSSMNTDNTPSSGSHPIQIEAVDTFSGVGSKTIYVRVTPNTSPNWRQTSVGGSVVNRFTQSLNENSVAGNNKVRVYYTDSESDSITIGSGSNVPSEFTITNGGTYIQLNQVTASLDFETTTKYEFVLTASDEHYVSSDDVESITYLPFQIAVIDNARPTVNDQTLSTINENTPNGTTVATITATDPESDTIIFSNFTLREAKLNAGANITSSLGGASLYNPHSDPFQCSSGGVVTRKNGIYLNSDIANKYIYEVTVRDSFNNTTDTGLITIPIANDTQNSVSDNWSNLYIIESSVSGDDIRITSNGRTGTSGQWSAGSSQRWNVTSTNNLITVTSLTGSSTTLELGTNLSGSGVVSGQTIAVALTASEHGFETTKQYIDTTISVTTNNAPSGSYTHTVGNLNTNGARSGSLLSTIAWTDTEGDSLNHSTFTLTDSSGQLNAVKSGNDYLIQAKNTLSGSISYNVTGSIKDTYGFSTGVGEQKLTIAQAPIGSLGGDTTSYIIESALSGSVIRDGSGFGAGNQSQLTVNYSPNYNSAAVQSFTSSHPLVSINNIGKLSLAAHVSGSPSSSGDSISSSITFQDQFGNIGSGSVSIGVFANQVPQLSFSNVTANLTASISANTNLVNLTISDTESDTPFSASIADSGATLLKLVPQNANSSSYQIQNKSTISSGQTIQYDIQVKDNFAKTTNVNNRTVVIKDQISLVYGYGWSGGSAASEASAISSMGDVGGDGVGITSGSVIAHLQSGSLGSTFTNTAGPVGVMNLVTSSALNTLSDTAGTGVSTLGYFNFSGGSQRLIILFASQSNQFGKPKTMYDGVPPDSTGTAKEYYVYAKNAAIPGTIGTGIYYFDTENPVQGYSRWGMIFAEGENTNNSKYYVMPDSASAP